MRIEIYFCGDEVFGGINFKCFYTDGNFLKCSLRYFLLWSLMELKPFYLILKK